MSDTVIRVENISKLYRLGEVGTGSLAHDVNRWWHKVRGKEDPYLKIGEVNDRTKPAARAVAGNESRVTGEEKAGAVVGSELIVASEEGRVAGNESRVTSENQPASGPATRHQLPVTAPQGGTPATSYSPLVTPKAPPSDWVYALKDVSFEVKRGEVLGIIGRNGAGKSTLLKILSRVTQQTEGRIKVRGRIASFLEVGTGFHPELTGRARSAQDYWTTDYKTTGWKAEPERRGGAEIGCRRQARRALRLGKNANQIARKFDEIVEFSGCARYIDTPVKRYSSGMYVRLAFAVAAHLEPEPRRQVRRDRVPQAGPKGFAIWDKRKPNFDRRRGLGGGRRGVPKKMPGAKVRFEIENPIRDIQKYELRGIEKRSRCPLLQRAERVNRSAVQLMAQE